MRVTNIPYIYASKAIILLLVKGKAGEAYNVGNESKSRSLKEIADFLASINGKKVMLIFPKLRKHDIQPQQKQC